MKQMQSFKGAMSGEFQSYDRCKLTTQLNDLPPEPIAISFLVAVREISKRSLTT
jgi:hypothetical protein